MNKSLLCSGLLVLMFLSNSVYAKDAAIAGPQAGGRTYAQNYKDRVFSICVARAYKDDRNAAVDAGSSAGAFIEWTSYDMENSPDAIISLVDSYLARDYRNPLVEPEFKDVKFDLLKCLDMYHSKELNDQVKRFVSKPNRTYRQDMRSMPK